MSKLLDSTIPIFSLADLQNGTRKEDFQRCLSEKGVFYLTDHGIQECEYQNFETTTIDFFSNASDQDRVELSNKNPATRRGFSGLESESTAKITATGSYTDYSMCYSMGVSNNVFPSTAFEQIWTKHFKNLDKLAKITATEVLQCNSVRATDFLLNCDPVLRFRSFPEVPENRCAENEPLRMAPHYDISIVTLINQTKCPNGFVSLQCNIDGVFVELPPLPNAFIVMCGAVASYLTGGQVKAPIHRVVAPSREQRVGSNRTSNVFFLRPGREFELTVKEAKACGLNIDADSVTITFQDWIGGNYRNLKTSEGETV
ncbi:deacetoxycephalosporin C synthase-like [Bradysia coprophila]|uniref:deacetoxycephalosporin C synthase-like n=1 Tax=Bradysia coprophila TaxID=38358 RepID=UPI00187DBAA9|nr:deacetoxycephalosporin C synthase-like [Bradysia coprophila]